MTRNGAPLLAVLVAGIGDLMLGRQALACLAAGHPDREIHLLTNAQAAPLAPALGVASTVWEFPIRDLRGGPGALAPMLRVVSQLRRQRYALAVNLYPVASRIGALKMGLLLAASGADRRVGAAGYGFGAALSDALPEGALAGLHMAEAMERIARRAGGADAGPLAPVDFSLAEGCRFDVELDGVGPLVGVNPGADLPGKLWPPERFAAVADALAAEFGARIAILGGPGEEAVGEAVRRAMRTPATVLTGRMTLPELAHVLTGLDLLVTNDSGPMHIAAAAGTPVAAVFGQADPGLFGPLAPEHLRRVVTASAPCSPCNRRDCEAPQCMLSIDADAVVAACRELLGAKEGGS